MRNMGHLGGSAGGRAGGGSGATGAYYQQRHQNHSIGLSAQEKAIPVVPDPWTIDSDELSDWSDTGAAVVAQPQQASAQTRKERQQRWSSSGVDRDIQEAVLDQLARNANVSSGGSGGNGGQGLNALPITFGFLDTRANAAGIQQRHEQVVFDARDRVDKKAKLLAAEKVARINERARLLARGCVLC